MPLGYDQPLYILPFDHRHSYGAEVFGFHEPLAPQQAAEIAASKQVIYEGYQRALAEDVPQSQSGILVDEEFGAAILRDAKSRGYITAMSVEKSGQHEFDFEYGDDFAAHLAAFQPTFAKVLVRFNPQGDAALNQRQLARLKRLNDGLKSLASPMRLMFELLVPPEPAQLAKFGGSHSVYDLNLRPQLMEQAIHQTQDAGVEPDVWKIEGLDRREDCKRIVAAARRDGRDAVGCIILGRGEDEQKVLEWLRTAASVPGFIGFAVGRSSFLEAIIHLRSGKITREAAVAAIATKFREWVSAFEAARGG